MAHLVTHQDDTRRDDSHEAVRHIKHSLLGGVLGKIEGLVHCIVALNSLLFIMNR